MNDAVIERVAREDPLRREPIGGARRREQAEATRARVLAAIEAGQPLPPTRWRDRTWRASGVVLAAVVVGLVAVVFVMVWNHTPPRSATTTGHAHPSAIAPAKPLELRPAGTVKLGDSPQALLADGGSLWAATPRSLVRLNLADGTMIARTVIPTNGVNAGLAIGAGSIWLAPTGTSQLLRFDPAANRLTADIRLGATGPGGVNSLGGGVAFAAGRIWVSRASNRPRGDVIAVNPATDRPAGAPIEVGSGPGTLASGFGSVWVDNTSVTIGGNATSTAYPAMSRIDTRTRHVTTEPFAGAPAIGFGSVWVQTAAGDDGAAIIRVDPTTGRTIARIPVPRVVGVASGDGRMWAIAYPRSRSATTFAPITGTAALWQIDPGTNRVVGRPLHLRMTQPIAIAVSRGQLWIGDYQSAKLIHFRLSQH